MNKKIPPKMRNEQLNAALAVRADALVAMNQRNRDIMVLVTWLRVSEGINCRPYQLARFLNARQVPYQFVPNTADFLEAMDGHRLIQELPKPDPDRQLAHLMKLNQQLAAKLLASPDAEADAQSIKLASQLLRTAIACESSRQKLEPRAQVLKPAPAQASGPMPEREDGWRRNKIEQMRMVGFQDVRDLLASGKLVIPEP